ncbi:AraC family transcriptional regulator [Paenibacillus cymbidii]|uniref:AraC family transcriptional regulator n=1 Tax=Paenibacillus cymbidii TaxID=1639034 RepID=UPI001080F68C|nr:AraC family transcriptional regulator [Paenibacillus cymbidii]
MHAEVWKQARNLLNRLADAPAPEAYRFHIHYWGVTPNHRDNPVHRHSFVEICYVAEGRGEYAENGTTHALEPGTLFCSRPWRMHQIRSRTGMLLLYVAFEADESRMGDGARRRFEALLQGHTVVLPGREDAPVALQWRSLLEWAGMANISRDVLDSAIDALLAALVFTFGGQTDQAADPAEWSKPAELLLREARLFIGNNLPEMLTLEGVAGYLHVSARHLSRLFSRELGLPFSRYVRLERVRQAELLLAGTDWPLKRIAGETGFDTEHYLSRVFRQERGLPPGQFREWLRRDCNINP